MAAFRSDPGHRRLAGHRDADRLRAALDAAALQVERPLSGPLRRQRFLPSIVPRHTAAPQVQGKRFFIAGEWRTGRMKL